MVNPDVPESVRTTTHGADSEVGTLRTVMLHRPGGELKRLTPRNNDRLLFDGVPWVSRAQEEHDAFAETLRNRGVEVLYLTTLLTETFASRRSEEHTSELQSLMRISYAVFCLKKKKLTKHN